MTTFMAIVVIVSHRKLTYKGPYWTNCFFAFDFAKLDLSFRVTMTLTHRTCIHPGFPLPINVTSASVRRLQEVDNTPVTYRGRPWQTPSATPYGAGPSETPLRTPRGEPVTKRPRYDIDSSLDDFQARYTSEDNASFTQNMDEENRKHKER
ncbi:hypothetical protein DEU56DRAFT_754469 [Suillus clintonianus]|uniref:uncharacterized protein n=1 Tax=Suillus clintonianus TaxID=1904413 RepID=UPI001B87A8A7|nr:uncharacterized protein DEU56DRAFT_754469 [Suillus clintonianus]KAG2143670.1 hypothetical protein DEU56DRAFT_754469 [Suillus clintonianus]